MPWGSSGGGARHGAHKSGRVPQEGGGLRVLERLAYGWSPEELQLQHPYLTLGQIHAAFAYYWDHREELDREIAERLKRVEDLRQKAEAQPSPVVARLKAQRSP